MQKINKKYNLFFEYIDTYNLFFKELDEDLNYLGHETSIICSEKDGLFSRNIKSVRKGTFNRIIKVAKIIFKNLRKNKKDIHIYSLPVFIIVSPFMYLIFRHQYIVICQGQLEGEGRFIAYFYRFLLSFSVLFSKKSFTCNLFESFRWDLWPFTILQKKLFHFSWYGVSLSRNKVKDFKKYSEKKTNLNKKDLIFGYLGRINSQKGCHILINYFNNEVNKNYLLKMTGKIEREFGIKYTNLLNKKFKNIIMEDSIKPSQVSDWMNNVDVFITFSKGESVGASTLEALLAGKPVISLINSGSCQVLRHGVDSFILKKISNNSIKEAIDYVRDNYKNLALSAENTLNKINLPKPSILARAIVND